MGNKKEIDANEQNEYLDSVIQYQEPIAEDNYILSKEDIHKSTREQNKKGSPGTDGLTPNFYLWAWEIMEEALFEVLNNCYLNKSMSETMRMASVTLLPKKGNLKNIRNWRPVSLLNTDYKILSKIITSRLRDEISEKISLEQKCAVKNRQISDIHLNILAMLKYCKRTNSAAILTCYDFTKAFDMLDHSMIFNSLKK